MDILDPGHVYQPAEFDGETDENVIVFMKREGVNYPGNVGHHAGTNCQEIIRILIDRVKYLDNQIPHPQNEQILRGLRRALFGFELRAAERHGRTLTQPLAPIEDIPACSKCGHIQCGHE